MNKQKKEKLHLALPPLYVEQWAKEIILCVRDPEWQKRFEKWKQEQNKNKECSK